MYRGHHPYIPIYARTGQLGHTCDTKRSIILSMAKDIGYISCPDKAHKPNPQATKTHLTCHSGLDPEPRTICTHTDKLPVHFLSQPVNIVDSMGKKCEKPDNKQDFTLSERKGNPQLANPT